jgi:outer membrane protein OmpA-like peptidoglycan-associated protein
MAEAVAEDGCAIGYISEFYHGNAKLVTINNITENYSRKLFLYYDTNYANPQITEIVNSFIQYATDRHGGQEAIESLGATPLENTFRAERTDCIHPTGKKLDADIRFDFNSDDLGRRSRSNLDKVRHSLLGAQSVLILGFSDNIGSQRGIQEISERRAAAVRNQLRLPDSVQVDSKGCGVKSSNDEDQDQSRTVEIWH